MCSTLTSMQNLGLITCVWSRIGQMARHSTPRRNDTGGLLIPLSDVDDAEGRVREHVGGENRRDETEHPRETRSEME